MFKVATDSVANTDSLQERDAVALKVKKENVAKRRRTEEAMGSDSDEEVMVVESRSRKRHRVPDGEVIVLD